MFTIVQFIFFKIFLLCSFTFTWIGWFPAKFVELLDERSKQYSTAGDDSVTENITDLVRGTLCPAIKQILEHGMKRPSFLGLLLLYLLNIRAKILNFVNININNSKLSDYSLLLRYCIKLQSYFYGRKCIKKGGEVK